jgi:hypothetical protein
MGDFPNRSFRYFPFTVLVALVEPLTNRQETKNAKETCWTPRNTLGVLCKLGGSKNNTQEGDHPF